jgi:cytidine deaminase
MTDDELIQLAIAASERAYAPYSAYRVGAALLAPTGEVFTGCNVENAVYPVSICAERGALVKGVSEGHQVFTTIVVATRDGGSPCGICRQALAEFAPDLRVILADFDDHIWLDTSLQALLPYGFGPSNLK